MTDSVTDQQIKDQTAAKGAEFRNTLPEEYRADPSFKDINDLGSLAKSHKNAQQLLGKNRIAVLGENPTDEERNAHFNSLGRPTEASGYAFKEDALHKDLIGGAEGMVKWAREAFHKRGLTKAAAEGLYEDYAGYMKEQIEAAVKADGEARTQAIDATKKELGTAFNERLELGKKALNAFGNEGLVNLINETGIGNNIHVINFLADVAKKTGADKIVDGKGPSDFRKSPAEAQAEIVALKADKSFTAKLMNAGDPGHKQAQEQMEKLHAQAYPEGQ